jgi:hypothetical protein
MRSLIVSLSLILAVPHLAAQSYENSPFYQKGDSAPQSAKHRYTAHANGVTATISVAFPSHEFAPWNEGMKVDGPNGHQIIHRWIEDLHSHVYFGYDLILEPVPGTQQVTCTFKPLTVSPQSSAALDPTLPSPPIPEGLDPLLLQDGETFNISMLPEAEHRYKLVEYVQVEVSHTAPTTHAGLRHAPKPGLSSTP